MAPQDVFFEEDEDNCPLCIEELDLSDRSFRPCPCGYQVCQFCFNNIKNNMNGLCPACRRPYDEKTIEWKVVTPEEVAEFSANIRKNQKKRALDQRQKEVQKREAEKENRKNLVGVRVVQKNLVYVTGLTPTVREDELLKTLRKPDFFGQYGNIQKISISNRKSSDGHNQSLGIYVTFEKKEDAQRCIQAVNGSQNGDRVLRAQLGTTKYCSAWLRHEQCTNRQCMFLHELGEEEDSYTRQDLSSMNSINTQRPLPPNGSSSRSASRQQSTPAPGPPPGPTPAAAPVAQPMARSSSKDESENGGDGSALPSSANWARNPQRSRRGSHATSGAAPSPAISTSLPVTAEAVPEAIDESPAEESSAPSISSQSESPPSPVVEQPKQVGIPENILKALLKAMEACPFNFAGCDSTETNDTPPMFDMCGGEKRRAMREEEEARLAVSANPRIMAQQSAMMPSSFHAQPGSQYYSSSMPGPPPGLKSTGTPPAMFGQGQGYGGAGFGAASKDSAELLQSLIRGRGAANSQAHDAAKRELMSSFSNQYPPSTSSSPAPAPGLLASLYGNPPGAFQDFGPKQQKKKGKKHRHANTSSSGGGGLVDLADPSILQARMQHQSQGSAGVGQGLFGGQSQDDELPSLDEASSSVDALVSDDPLDTNLFIQGFGSSRASTATPGPPPGLGLSHRHPSPAIRTTLAAPVVPTMLQQPARVATPTAFKTQTLASVVGSVTPDQTPRKKMPGSEAKKSIKALAVESGLSKDIAASSPALRSKKLLQEEDFPALDAVKSPAPKTIAPAVPSVLTPKTAATPSKRPQTETKETNASSEPKPLSEPVPSTPSKATESLKSLAISPIKPTSKAADSKPAPVLNIAAAVKAAQAKTSAEASTVSSSDKADSAAFPALPPSAASVSSPSVKAAPKTLRVVNTPKAEVPPTLPMSGTLNAATRALSGVHRPDTPGSHDISDTASVVSTSISVSRTSSPPPSRIGSAPVRTNTKSQQRKARKEANKVAAIVEAAKPAEPEEHAPILGRKKKVKKEKPVKTTEKKTSATAAAPSSTTAAEFKTEDTDSTTVAPKRSEGAKQDQKAKAGNTTNASQDKGKGKEKAVAPSPKNTPKPASPEPAAPAAEESKDAGENPKTSPEYVFHELVSSGMSFAADMLQLLKPVNDQSNRGGDRAAAAAADTNNPPPSTKSIVTEKDHAKLLSGKPVRKVIDGHRVLITPNGDCLRHLTEQEEQNYLFYQKRARGAQRVPSFFPPPPSQQQRLFADDPVNKLQREEAISYINQFVLPRLNLGTANLGFASNWKSHGNANNNAQEFQLTGTKRDVAAASLNTLAPWIYGHDAAAGAGIYSAESGNGGLRDVPEDETPFGGLDSAHPHHHHPHQPHGVGYGSGPDGVATAAGPGGPQQYLTKLPPLNGMSLMSVEEAESALQLARKETERLEKGLNQGHQAQPPPPAAGGKVTRRGGRHDRPRRRHASRRGAARGGRHGREGCRRAHRARLPRHARPRRCRVCPARRCRCRSPLAGRQAVGRRGAGVTVLFCCTLPFLDSETIGVGVIMTGFCMDEKGPCVIPECTN
ncbi:general negative regulator of transcription subunit 4 [Verticillium alfalfae VaMs.102]|uniref:General negative regulator of transcription subunit 4 n=1 Tax=Verticillium alfalfae (strain VaMs.102 / ATCC MYA-4576 / FGSC 10136) TaxID=526221 RepID=C9SSM7_VERA1|nr:general negative regulator of transcription subunit 4 [Verticillium alfalfae VaMs.102]EEY21792.1 general negative regulator of transcription subunit 4 [Verticillium alfalfae VaMs.102]